jgi:aspartate aminotransferase
LGAGEPDFDTPAHIKAAGIAAIQQGKTKYTPNVGTLALREAICRRIQLDCGARYESRQIVVCNGAKQAIHNALIALCNPGDEVVIPSPYWVSYPEQVKMTGAVPKIVPAAESNSFKITAGQLAQALTPSTKVVILNNPGNPTGAVYSKAELQELAEVILRQEVFLLSDEIYIKLVYDGQTTASMASFPALYDRLLLVNGFSKAYAMTGWRLGYLAAPHAVTQSVAKIQSHTTSNACSISQEAGQAAVTGDETDLQSMRAQFERRRNFVCEALGRMPGVSVRMPGGAFYVLFNVAQVLNKTWKAKTIHSPSALCNMLIEHAGVALVSGEAFGAPQHLRLSYATSMENLQEAMQRLHRAFAEICQV